MGCGRKQVGCSAIYGAIRLGAAHLEAAHHLAQMAGHATAHEKQPMKMIGHHGALKQLNLWVEGWNLPPAPGDGFAKGRMLDALAYKATKQLATPFDPVGIVSTLGFCIAYLFFLGLFASRRGAPNHSGGGVSRR